MKRVFIVDDEPDVVELIETVLELEGYSVSSETNGRQALTRILEDPPDLVILDLMMPDLDGMELLKLLRAQPQGAGIPVVIVSARTSQLDQIGSLQLGANAYICKPFSNRDLLAQVEQLIGLPENGPSDG